MYGQRRLYFHLRKGEKSRMLIGIPLSPQFGAKAGIQISCFYDKNRQIYKEPALNMLGAGSAWFLAARLS